MTKADSIRPEFADRVPKSLQDGVLYVSKKYSTAAHRCCCGCGTKIVTPLKPGRWRLTVHGGLVSLDPSIGNWSAACQSHYWIEDSQVIWTRGYTAEEIAANRAGDKRALEAANAEHRARARGFWARLWTWIRGWFRS
jgi:hypothetical protein